MQLTTFAMSLAALSTLCLAVCESFIALPTNTDTSEAPAKNQLEKRQTYIITCIGGRCSDGSTPVPSVVPKPTTTTTRKPEPSKSSIKVTPTPAPSKTTITTTPKSTIKPTTTSGGDTGPSSTACPVPLYYQCGGYYDGKPWTGCTKCVKGAKCVVQNEFYDQCVADED
ncbi:Nn.00g096060.m01.CDS01 [Neocucurbitaria sp. VM-36]